MPFTKRAKAPEEDPTSIGNLLLNSKLCTEMQLREAIAIQRSQEDHRLGSTLVKLGYITQEALDFALQRQEMMRTTGSKGVQRYVNTATRITLELSGNIDSVTQLAKQALAKMKA